MLVAFGELTLPARQGPLSRGADSAVARDLATAFYATIIDRVVPVSSSAAAEAVKITENVFRAVNISSKNCRKAAGSETLKRA